MYYGRMAAEKPVSDPWPWPSDKLNCLFIRLYIYLLAYTYLNISRVFLALTLGLSFLGLEYSIEYLAQFQVC